MLNSSVEPANYSEVDVKPLSECMRTAKIGPDLRLTCLSPANPGDMNGSCRGLTTYCSSYRGGEFNTKQIASFFMFLIP